MKETHTPKPWKLDLSCIRGPQGEPIALLHTSAKQRRKANAALICAAKATGEPQ